MQPITINLNINVNLPEAITTLLENLSVDAHRVGDVSAISVQTTDSPQAETQTEPAPKAETKAETRASKAKAKAKAKADAAAAETEVTPKPESTPDSEPEPDVSVTKKDVLQAVRDWLDADDSHDQAAARVILQKISDDEAVNSVTKLEPDFYAAAVEAFAV